MPHKIEMKWALKVWIPFLAMLQRWSWGGDKLVRQMVLLDCCLEFCRTLIIKNMMLGIYSLHVKVVNEALICSCHFASCPIFNCRDKDSGVIDVDEDHDV